MITEMINITGEGEETTTKTLFNLSEFTNYSIAVLAFTVKGDGPSVALVVQTKQDSKFQVSVLSHSWLYKYC